jgi:hypothetical protein
MLLAAFRTCEMEYVAVQHGINGVAGPDPVMRPVFAGKLP